MNGNVNITLCRYYRQVC